MRGIISISIIILYCHQLLSQCTYVGPEIIAPISTRFFNLEISGVLNDDLSDQNQGVCLVLIDFEHPIIGDLTIKLISPANDTITLVGPNGISGFTNRSRWNISFLPCGAQADPDQGFSSVWNNIQPWGQFGYFDGAYHPYNGCLEDFNSGGVNGIWQLMVQNNYPFDVPANAAILHDFSIIFCDQDGLECEFCLAKGGSLSVPADQYCLGDQQLLLDIDRITVGLLPDEEDYDYLYFIAQNNVIIESSPIADLRSFPAGIYEVCGLSYLIEDSAELVQAFETLSPNQLRANLRSNTALFCGAVSNNCLSISIGTPSDTTFIQEYLCRGDTIYFQGFPFYESGTYTLIAENTEGCDSIIELNLTEIRFNASAIQPDTLDCNMQQIPLYLIDVVSSVPSDSLSFRWLDSDMNLLSIEDTVWISNAGIYALVVTINYFGKQCEVVYDFEVLERQTQFNPVLNFSNEVCAGSQVYIEVVAPLIGSYTWSIKQGDANIISPQGMPVFILNIGNSLIVEFCLDFNDGCTNFDQICFEIDVIQSDVPELAFLDSICGFSNLISVNIGSLTHTLDLLKGPGTVSISSFNDQEFEVIVDEPGTYDFTYSDMLSTCKYEFSFSQSYFPSPDFSAISISEILCAGDSIIVNVLFNYREYDYDFSYAFGSGGTINQLQILDGALQLVLFPEGDTLYLSGSLPGFRNCAYEHQPLTFSIILEPQIDTLFSVNVCNTAENGTTVFDFSTVFGPDLIDVTILGLDGIALGTYPVYDFLGTTEGIYEFTYSVNYHPDCTSFIGRILIEVANCLCPDYLTGNMIVVCGNDAIDLGLVATDGFTGIWSQIEDLSVERVVLEGGKIIDFSNYQPGAYYFLFSVSNPAMGCPDFDTLAIEVNPVFRTGSVNIDTIRICFESDVEFNLFDYLSAFDFGGVWVYQGNGFFQTEWLDSVNGNLITEAISAGIYHFLYRSADQQQCSNDSVQLILKVELKEFTDLFADVLLGCTADSAIFRINSDSLVYSVFWEVLDGEFVITNPESLEVIIDQEGVFRINLLNKLNGCIIRETFEVKQIENPLTAVDFLLESPLCLGGSSGIIEIQNVEGGLAPFTYRLDGSIFTSLNIFDGLSAGTYTVSVRDSRGCLFTEIVELLEPPRYYISIGPDLELLSGDSYNFIFETDIPDPLIGFTTWYINGIPECAGCLEFDDTFFRNTIVVLELISIQGCIYYDSLLVKVDDKPRLFVPQAFTPNGDGINDNLLLFSPDPSLKVNHWEIFDRWGSSVFFIKDFFPFNESIGWDGQFNNKLLMPGEYVYYIEISRPEIGINIIKGSILLAR